MARLFPLLAMGAVLALPLCPVGYAQTAAAPATAAYPDNPSGTPATTTNGTAPAGPKVACPAAGPCPDSPGAAAQAGPGTAAGEVPQPGRIATPSTAYPDSPVKTPAAEPSGTAPK